MKHFNLIIHPKNISWKIKKNVSLQNKKTVAENKIRDLFNNFTD